IRLKMRNRKMGPAAAAVSSDTSSVRRSRRVSTISFPAIVRMRESEAVFIADLLVGKAKAWRDIESGFRPTHKNHGTPRSCLQPLAGPQQRHERCLERGCAALRDELLRGAFRDDPSIAENDDPIAQRGDF